MNEAVINDALEFVRKIFNDDDSGHDHFHTLRVYKMAITIAQKEGADLFVVQLAALLHDVDDIKLSPATYADKRRAVSFLREHHLPEATIKAICDIIGEVSFRGTDSVMPETIEGKCVQDADRLDAMGAIGIARAFAYGGSRHRIIYDPEVKPTANMNAGQYYGHESSTINHFYEKLLQLKDLMNTATAKEIARQRDAYMKAYLSEFLDEWNGIR